MSYDKYKSQLGYKGGVLGIPYAGSEVNPSGKTETDSTKRYVNHLSSPAITHTTETTDAGYITKTETTVEFSRVPMANTHPEAALPQKKGPVNNLRWWYKPKYIDNGETFEPDRKNVPFKDKSSKLSDPSMHQQYFNICRKETDETHMPTMSITSGWAKSKVVGKEAQLKGIPAATLTNIIQTAIGNSKEESIVVTPTQGHVTPYVVSNGELLLPHIDSHETARRYGGVATSSAEAYAPAIDSREAAWKYRGQII